MSAELCKLPPSGDAPLRKLVAYLLRLKWQALVSMCEDALLKRLTARALKLNDRRSLKSRLWDARPWGWKTVRVTGKRRSSSSLCTRYQVHPSGRRRAVQTGKGHQPIDRQWVEGGEWSGPPIPAHSPSAIQDPASDEVEALWCRATRQPVKMRVSDTCPHCGQVGHGIDMSELNDLLRLLTRPIPTAIVGGSGMTRQVVDQMNELQARGATLRKAKARAVMHEEHEEHACD